ncbi:MAG TPA: PilZ domain-containing protein [Rectinemataceae bacterium]|nr:PilZ domain-containing protein [Rectinemataceae bacterium]
MKALLIVENDRIADIARFYLRPLGFEAVRYRNVLKALDNLEEIEPNAIVVSARDFPRHWKIIAQVARTSWSKDRCVIILLKGELFPFEEAAKAAHIGVNGVVRDNLDDRHEQTHFQHLLKRYVTVEESRSAERVAPSAWDRLDFIFAHPLTFSPVAGRLETVSLAGISFIPDSPALVADLDAGTAIEDCSLRVGDRILSLSCTVVRSDRVLGLEIASMAEDDRDYLDEYLASCPEREMRALLKKV